MKRTVSTRKLLERQTSEVWEMEKRAFLNHFRSGSQLAESMSIEIDVADSENDTTAPITDLGGGVKSITINGQLGLELDDFEKWCGFVDYRDIIESARELEEDPETQTIVVSIIASPGGTTMGSEDVGDYIAGITGKTVVTHVSGMGASAAYKIGCAAKDGMFAAASAEVGCIGTIMSFVDYSEMLRRAGAEPHVIASGKYKAAGHPFESATDEQLKYLENLVAALSDRFKNFVRAHRGAVDDSAMEGQVMLADEAMATNLIDDVMPLRKLVAMYQA